MNEETSVSDYSEFMSEFAPALGQIPGRISSNARKKRPPMEAFVFSVRDGANPQVILDKSGVYLLT